MAAYVVLTALSYQRGSAESKDPDKREDVDDDPHAHVGDPAANSTVRAGGWLLGVYQHSLSIALFLLFVVSFVLHLIASAKEDCAEKLMHGRSVYDDACVPWKLEVLVRVVSELAERVSFGGCSCGAFDFSAGEGLS